MRSPQPASHPDPSSVAGILSDAVASANASLAATRSVVEQQNLPTKLTHPTLCWAIAEALYGVSAHHLADECVRLGLAPQSGGEDGPMAGKRSYVIRRLRDHSLEELLGVARRVNEDYETAALTHLIALAGVRGVDGELKNLIFAATGPKPKIVLADALSNTIEITHNAEHCLVYDRPLPEAGLSWRALTSWWAGAEDLEEEAERAAARTLYSRLAASMAGNAAERFLFTVYARRYKTHGFDVPALIPQVYLHYDPYTQRTGATLSRQRMDFLLLLPGRRRVVLELDGIQHYADAQHRASPQRYAQMVAEDRRLRLAGYEVYRFGGHELTDRSQAASMLEEFFTTLLDQ